MTYLNCWFPNRILVTDFNINVKHQHPRKVANMTSSNWHRHKTTIGNSWIWHCQYLFCHLHPKSVWYIHSQHWCSRRPDSVVILIIFDNFMHGLLHALQAFHRSALKTQGYSDILNLYETNKPYLIRICYPLSTQLILLWIIFQVFKGTFKNVITPYTS